MKPLCEESVGLFWFDPVTDEGIAGTADSCPAPPNDRVLLCHATITYCIVKCDPNETINNIDLFIGMNVPGENTGEREKHIPPILDEAKLIRFALDMVATSRFRDFVDRSGGIKQLGEKVRVWKGMGHHLTRYERFF